MINPKLIPSILVFAGAVIFAGALVWHGLRTAPSKPMTVPPPPEQKIVRDDIPHYPNANQLMAGTITNVGNNTITVDLQGDPNVTPVQQVVSITSSTQIFARGAKKDLAVYKTEMDAFLEKVKTAGGDVIYVAPSMYVHTKLAFSDLATGDIVLITPAKVEGSTVEALSIEVAGN